MIKLKKKLDGSVGRPPKLPCESKPVRVGIDQIEDIEALGYDVPTFIRAAIRRELKIVVAMMIDQRVVLNYHRNHHDPTDVDRTINV